MDHVAVACQVIGAYRCELVASAKLTQQADCVEVVVTTVSFEEYTVRFRASKQPKGIFYLGTKFEGAEVKKFFTHHALIVNIEDPDRGRKGKIIDIKI